MAEEFLGDRKRTLEEEFFRKQERAAIERLRATHAKVTVRDALAQASGLTDEAALDRLSALGIAPETLLALSLVPLVAVAWADGALEEKERRSVVAALGPAGIAIDSPAGQLVQGWLESPPPPSLLDAWTTSTAELSRRLAAAERESLRASVLGRARAVAEAAGGLLGLGSKISAAEEAMLARLAKAFAA